MRAGGRLILAACLLLVAAACASGGSRPSQVILRMPPVNYGPPGDARNPAQGPFQPNQFLRLCPGTTVSNAPAADAERWVRNFNPLILAHGIVLASVPANDVCLTSGFGYRGGSLHAGIDVASRPPGTVYSGGPGRIVEAGTSSGYGLNVVIDHGRGVFTRYAHLDWFAPGIAPGVSIGFGHPIGQMGSTGNATAPHLHYEILTGDLANPRGSFGLRTHDPFAFPPYDWTGY